MEKGNQNPNPLTPEFKKGFEYAASMGRQLLEASTGNPTVGLMFLLDLYEYAGLPTPVACPDRVKRMIEQSGSSRSKLGEGEH